MKTFFSLTSVFMSSFYLPFFTSIANPGNPVPTGTG